MSNFIPSDNLEGFSSPDLKFAEEYSKNSPLFASKIIPPLPLYLLDKYPPDITALPVNLILA